ncbi:MAG TPA: sigma 54-interacting transcriptional regulator [Candidatus Methylomirabilis sp.]|nr:sigma 54-interacting transcriptional regulator [Candidatus Methylomirabilis sp.]
MSAPAYEVLEELSRSQWSALRRGRRRQDGRAVLLKVLRDGRFRAADVDLLRREYEILRGLSVPGIPCAHALEHLEGAWCLALEDRGGIPLQSLIGDGRTDLGRFFDIATRLATILAELHRRDVICRYLCPRSILVHPTNGEVCLWDFGLAVRASAATGASQTPLPPHILRDALVYLSPELTGRMNRGIDYRTDFYSLGVTLYELLTGEPPFRSDDPLELIHWHIAKTPPAPSVVHPAIPEPLSRIVMTLLAKTAEERYQSGLGLREDLETCARDWSSRGRVAPFPLRGRDVSDRFLIPQKLYGREREVEALVEAFDRTCEGPSAMMLVSGYPGIGKTSLIQELYKPIVRQRGYFIAGKFDQIVRNIPHGALIQAFRALIRHLLTESEDRLALWRSRLGDGLGTSGGVLAEVIPEIELILGRQPPPPPLGPTEAQNRFQFVFQKFVRALARPEHPLVVFLDDLQWADTATLGLLQPLLTNPEVRFLFVIGAFRDSEGEAGHALARSLALLEAGGVLVHRIVLGPLRLQDLTLLVGDTLHGEPATVEPLAALVQRKTDGNPFFVLQFLKMLRQEGLVAFDHAEGRWTFRLEDVAAAAMTDNVIDLMTHKIQRLSGKTQHALTLAACIGNPFDPETLAIVSQQPYEAVADDLAEALEEGLILPAGGPYDPAASAGAGPTEAAPTYTFLHDRVQQAAYALIPDDRKQLVHLTVGRLLRERWDPATAEGRLFDVVHHLNLGSGLVTEEGERLALARLNLQAGRKAKSSTAFQAALGYFATGIGLLTADHWGSEYAVMFSLHLEAAECLYLCGRFDEAEGAFDALLPKARTRLDRARIHSLKILQYEHTSRYADAIRTGREGLALFGLTFPDRAEERQAALEAELHAIQTLLRDRPIDALIDLPIMQDPEIRAVMQLLSNLHTSCFLSGNKPLTLLNNAAMVRLSLSHGNMEESAYAYALHAAMLVGPIREDHRSAYEYGTLAMRLNERLPNPALRAKVLMMFAWAINLWRMPLETSFPVTREAFRLGHETGLFVDAAWALFNEIWFALLTSDDLAAFAKLCASNVDYSVRIKMPHIADAKRVLLQWGRALQGLTEHPLSLTDATFDEAAYRRTYAGQRLFEMFYFVAKLAVLYAFDEYQAACEAARAAERVIMTDFTGTIWDELRVFYHALARLALSPGATGARGEILAELDALNARLRRWAENSPHNFQPQHLVVSAEMARVQGKDIEAMGLYEAAIEAATTFRRPRERALANELYAKFLRDRGEVRLAAEFLTEARDTYAQWGAAAKVGALERRYPDLLTPQGSEGPAARADALEAAPRAEPPPPRTEPLDMSTVMKAAQAIAGEIELGKLLAKLMRIAIENAGAERGSLVLEHGGRWLVHAEGSMEAVEVRLRDATPLHEAQGLPIGLVNYVRRTSESLVLRDARSDERSGADPYILRHQPRSILCVPVLHQGRLMGVLYLENNLTSDAFTPERIELMQILVSQAAISLENARLYDDMRQEVAARRRAEEDLRVALAEVESLKNRLQAENVYLQEEIRREHNFVEMVGSSPALLAVLRKVEQVAPTDSTVLISGETGTGKELIARAIHNRSARKDRPLVKVNCAAISAGLVESELFGHVKGAFTGALERRVGRFELADGGTIFLDEVGELPPETQVKLLRVLQEGEFEPVGTSKTTRVDVRVIGATNRDLQEAVNAGRFRADLFYRLNVFPLEVPPLRQRLPDLPQLVMYFVSRFARKFGRKIDAVSQETMDRLAGYPWPGNIRELQNIIERAVVLSQDPILRLGQDLLPAEPVGARHSSDAGSAPPEKMTAQGGAGFPPDGAMVAGIATLEDMERHHILAALQQTRGVIEGPKGAAKILNLHPNTLRSRMTKLGIKRSRHEIP